MKTQLRMTPSSYDELMSHLFSNDEHCETAAFMFAETSRIRGRARFDVIDMYKLHECDFVEQRSHYIELRESTQADVIKRAHDLRTSLIEIHSHIGFLPAKFSVADLDG